MKRKFLVLAGVVAASLAMSTSVFAKQGSGDVNRSGSLDVQDAALILQLALDKDYSTANVADSTGVPYAWDEANADGDVGFAQDKEEITANDAAYVYDKVMNGTQLYVKLTTGSGVSFKAKASLNDKLIDLADTILTADDSSAYAKQVNKRKARINQSVDNVKFYSGNEIIGDVELREVAGWQIFTNALVPVIDVAAGVDVTDPTQLAADAKYNSFLNDLAIGYVDVDYSVIRDKYTLAKTLIKKDITKEDLQNTFNNVVAITKGKYGLGLSYTDPNTSADVNLFAKNAGDADAQTMINLICDNNLNKYEDVTLGEVQAVFGNKATAKVNKITATLELVEE